MALVLANRVQELGTANTTVSFTLTGAVQGFQSFAAVGNGNTTYYSAFDGAGNWEVGLGTYSTTGPTLTRTTVYASSASGSAVTFSGVVTVFLTYPSGRSVNLDASGNVSALGTVASGTWQGSTVGVAYGGTGVTASSGANSVMLRDANQNVAINRLNQANTDVTAAGGTTALTAASSYSQTLTGTGGQTYTMPDATTLTTGVAFVFNNNATGTLTLQDYATGTIGTVTPGGACELVLLANGTTGGTWDVHGFLPESVTWGTNALALGSTVITGGTWNGGAIQPGYGGTGLTTFVGANNALYSTGASTLTAGTLPAAAGGTGNTTGQAASVANAVTFNNGGSGDASGTTFNGSAARTISYNTVGALGLAGGTMSGDLGVNGSVSATSFKAGPVDPTGAYPSASVVTDSISLAQKFLAQNTVVSASAASAPTTSSITTVSPAATYTTGNSYTSFAFNGMSAGDLAKLSATQVGSSMTVYYGDGWYGSDSFTRTVASVSTVGTTVTVTFTASWTASYDALAVTSINPFTYLAEATTVTLNNATTGWITGKNTVYFTSNGTTVSVPVSSITGIGTSTITITGSYPTIAAGQSFGYLSASAMSLSAQGGDGLAYSIQFVAAGASNHQNYWNIGGTKVGGLGSSVAVGYQAANADTQGSSGAVLIGDNAGLNYSVGAASTNGAVAIGYEAMYSTTNATGNVAIGWRSLYSNSIGTNSVAIGTEALYSAVASASGSVAVGYQAARASNTPVTAIGYLAGTNNTASFNTFVGYQAGLNNISSSTNTFIGYNAGLNNNNPNFQQNNTFIGYQAGQSVTTGYSNTIIGASSGSSTAFSMTIVGSEVTTTTSSSYSTAVGQVSKISGTRSVAIGYNAGSSNPSSSDSVSVGANAGAAITLGTSNTFVGSSAGSTVNSGGSNTFVGANAGSAVNSGANNTIIGRFTGNDSGQFNLATASNYVVLSANAQIAAAWTPERVQLTYQPAPTTKAAPATLTAAEVATRIITCATGTYTITLPTGTTLDGGWKMPIDYSIDITFIATGTGTITIAGNTGVTIVGLATLTNTQSAQFRLRKTAAATYVAYRIS